MRVLLFIICLMPMSANCADLFLRICKRGEILKAFQRVFQNEPRQKIAKHPAFMEWVERSGDPFVNDARAIAEKLSWGMVEIISEKGGIQAIQNKQGCQKHNCIGCAINSPKMPDLWEMELGDYKKIIRSLVGLERALNFITNRNYVLIQRDFAFSNQYDGDGLNMSNVYERLVFFHKTVGSGTTEIATSGWDSRSQTDVVRIVEDIKAGRAYYLHKLALSVKLVSSHFARDVEKFMHNVLSADPYFMSAEVRDDFQKHKLDFKKYKDPERAYKIYSSLFYKNAEAVFKTSKYMQHLMSNINTIRDVINTDKILINFYTGDIESKFKHNDLVSQFLWPVLERTQASRYAEFLGLNRSDYVLDSWNFDYTLGKALQIAEYRIGTPIVMLNGSIWFTGGKPDGISVQLPDLAASSNPHLQDFAYYPIFSIKGSDRPYWQIASDRLIGLGARPTTLTERELQSIRLRTVEQSGDTQSSIDKTVKYVNIKNRISPVVMIHVANNKSYWFNFIDGKLYDIK